MTGQAVTQTKPWPDYRAIWRWHFYAGLFCIPFVIWLAATGPIYLFKPQVEAWLDRPYAHRLPAGAARATPAAEVHAALAARPGTVLHAYQLPAGPGAAAQVLVGQGKEEWRIWVDPVSLKPLKTVKEDHRFMRVIFNLHGQLLMGDRGSMAVELAASWAVVMIITGLCLWWPRGQQGLGGLIYPRLGLGRSIFWRDMHAAAGVWVSAFTLALLISGLPWAASWGGYLKAVRQLTGRGAVQQDWSSSRSAELAERVALSRGSLAGQTAPAKAADNGMAGMAMDHHGIEPHRAGLPAAAYADIDRVAPTLAALKLDYPVLISPPLKPGAPWAGRSDTQNRPRRVTVTIDGRTGALLSRLDFQRHSWVDQAVGYGVAAHEGQLFGWPNQVLELFTATGLLTASVSAIVMWWGRRPRGVLGAPIPTGAPRFSAGLLAIIMALAVLLPLFGVSLALTWITERLILRRIPGLRLWLGLSAPGRPSASGLPID
jgi:uncharacterized iron-regulated membrane protein